MVEENTAKDIRGQHSVIMNAWWLAWKYLLGFIFIDIPVIAMAPVAFLTHRVMFLRRDSMDFGTRFQRNEVKTTSHWEDWATCNDDWWWDLKKSIFTQFLLFLVDVITLCPLAVTMCSWRNIRLVLRLPAEGHEHHGHSITRILQL